MAELEKLGIGHERIRLSQAAGFEPLATPDEQFAGAGYARVELSLLNETTGAKLAQHGGTTKGRVKVRETSHAPEKPASKAADSRVDKPSEPHGEKPTEQKAPSTGQPPADGPNAAPAANPTH